jgi:hypothetical protein
MGVAGSRQAFDLRLALGRMRTGSFSTLKGFPRSGAKKRTRMNIGFYYGKWRICLDLML